MSKLPEYTIKVKDANNTMIEKDFVNEDLVIGTSNLELMARIKKLTQKFQDYYGCVGSPEIKVSATWLVQSD